MEYTDFPALLSRSDVVSVHTPLTPQTAGMFGASAFAAMKEGAIFVNTSRGGVVDEDALRRGLLAGRPGWAALDVLSVEPQSADCPLIGLSNVILTPHVAWAPLETRQRLVEIVLGNLEAYLAGRPTNVVN